MECIPRVKSSKILFRSVPFHSVPFRKFQKAHQDGHMIWQTLVTSPIINLLMQTWWLDLCFQGQGVQIRHSHKALIDSNTKSKMATKMTPGYGNCNFSKKCPTDANLVSRLCFQGQGVHIWHSHKPLMDSNIEIQDGHQDDHQYIHPNGRLICETFVTSPIIILLMHNWCLDLWFQGQGLQIWHTHKALIDSNKEIQDGHKDIHEI